MSQFDSLKRFLMTSRGPEAVKKVVQMPEEFTELGLMNHLVDRNGAGEFGKREVKKLRKNAGIKAQSALERVLAKMEMDKEAL